ncbi:carbohydrate sulfotransferase 11-like [Acanthaster planci]|uniref:Carbohydrate sulfotransferase n=1 Tax=Acanthaster planci TaxID=133434 RepID=A0A8B7YSP7_ACAPL|nr:carbohydrate sulfotransferase 11-like [Acanthaster planci]
MMDSTKIMVRKPWFILAMLMTTSLYLILCRSLRDVNSGQIKITGRWRRAFHGDQVKGAMVSQHTVWLRQQMSRKQLLLDNCAAFNSKADSIIPPLRYPADNWTHFVKELNYLVVVEPLKVVYCSIPKVGSSTIKWMLLNVTGHMLPGNAHSIAGKTFHSLNRYPIEKAKEIMATYRKFLFVRNPLERFLSAYLNKIETTIDGNLWRTRDAIRSLDDSAKSAKKVTSKKKATSKKKVNRRGRQKVKRKEVDIKITLPQFTRYVLAINRSADQRVRSDMHLNEHWNPMYEMCQPCLIDYDWIGHFEHLQTDIQWILSALVGGNQTVYVPEHDPKHTTNSSERDTQRRLFTTLNSLQVEKLLRYYELDYSLFGFDIPPSAGNLINNGY